MGSYRYRLIGLIFHAHVEKASGSVEWQRVGMAFE